MMPFDVGISSSFAAPLNNQTKLDRNHKSKGRRKVPNPKDIKFDFRLKKRNTEI